MIYSQNCLLNTDPARHSTGPTRTALGNGGARRLCPCKCRGAHVSRIAPRVSAGARLVLACFALGRTIRCRRVSRGPCGLVAREATGIRDLSNR